MTQKHHLKTALTTTSPPTHSEVLLSLRPLSLWINFKLLNPVSIFSLLTSKRLQKSSNWSIFYKPFHTMFSCQSSNTVWIPLFKSLHWVPTVLKKKKKKGENLSLSLAWKMLHYMATTHLYDLTYSYQVNSVQCY